MAGEKLAQVRKIKPEICENCRHLIRIRRTRARALGLQFRWVFGLKALP